MTLALQTERWRTAAARGDSLLKITAAIADAVTSEQVYEALVDHVAEAVRASSAALWLLDEQAGRARLARAVGYTDANREALLSLPLDLPWSFPALDAIRTGEPVWLSSQAALLERYPHLARMTTPGRAYRVSCMPLATRARIAGVLALTMEHASDDNDDEQDFLLLVARYASQAVERLRLLEAEQRSRAEADAAALRIGVLGRASQAFGELELELGARLRGVVSELGRALDSCVSVFLREADGLVHLTAVHHPEAEAQDILQRLAPALPLRVGEGVTGAIVESGESVLLPHLDAALIAARAAPAYRTFMERFPAHALIGAPLRVRGRVIGAVTATRMRAGETYGDDDLHLLEQLADRGAVAIDNARLYHETLEARARAEETVRQNELLAGVLAHDLRTPLNAIMGAAQLLLIRHEGKGTVDERETRPLGRILSTGRRMVTMIDQLLDFTRTRAGGGLAVHAEEVDLAEVYAQALAEIELAHPDWPIHSQLHGDSWGAFDQGRLLQLISNVIANAGKHGERDGRISVVLDGSHADEVRLDVHNRGTIPPALLPHVFDPFRSGSARRDHSLGLGLGLFIVREVVRAHHGTLELTSSDAEGTRLSIRLPRRRR